MLIKYFYYFCKVLKLNKKVFISHPTRHSARLWEPKGPGNILTKLDKYLMINSGWMRLSTWEWARDGREVPN